MCAFGTKPNTVFFHKHVGCDLLRNLEFTQPFVFPQLFVLLGQLGVFFWCKKAIVLGHTETMEAEDKWFSYVTEVTMHIYICLGIE